MVTDTQRKRADALKEVGNAAARRGDWATAERRYSEALQLTPHDHLIRSNRSLVYTKLGRGEDALGDARVRRSETRQRGACELRAPIASVLARSGTVAEALAI